MLGKLCSALISWCKNDGKKKKKRNKDTGKGDAESEELKKNT